MAEERPVCRRCKKKRPQDEPLETARYRTCKPCREIERKKKRLKKLELTGREVQAQVQIAEGMVKPQYQVDQSIINLANQVTRATQLPLQQHQYDHLNPPVLAPITYQQQAQHDVQQRILQQHQAQQQQAQQQAQAAAQAAAQAQQAISKQKVDEREIPIDELLLKQDGQEPHHDPKLLTQEALDAIAQTESLANKTTDSEDNNNLFAALKNAEANEQLSAALENVATSAEDFRDDELNQNVCLYCGATRDIQDNGRYQLCANCVENPLDTGNVFDDFDAYLTRVNLGKIADLKNIVFIKRFGANEVISDFKRYHDEFDSNNLDLIAEELIMKFINPIIEASTFKFSKSSSNLSSKPVPKSIKLLYKCKQDIKTTQKVNPQDPVNLGKLKTEECQSSIYLSYDISTKDLTIKFSHKTHKPFLEKKYSPQLVDKVKNLYLSHGDLNIVFDVLQTLQDEELRDEINELKRSSFVKDFSNF